MNYKLLLCVFIFLKVLPAQASPIDTVRLFYNINQTALTAHHKATLDSLNRSLTDTMTVRIYGFADYLWKRDSNDSLSKVRAEEVKKYLLSLHSKNIKIVANGKGQLDASTKNLSPLGEPFHRRVDIIVSKAQKAISPAKIPVRTIPEDKIGKMLSSQPPSVNIKIKDDSVYNRISDLPKLKIGDSVSFKEFTFQPGRHFLRQIAIPYMVALKNCLKENPNVKIEIQGHICCETDGRDGLDFDTHKNTLSINRAKFIYDYLIDEGIKAERLRYKGLASKEPKVFPELSAEDQNQNRRVVIVLLAK